MIVRHSDPCRPARSSTGFFSPYRALIPVSSPCLKVVHAHLFFSRRRHVGNRTGPIMPRSHENYGQSRQLRAHKTWTPVRARGPWDARTKLNLLRYCGHMHTGGLRSFYVVSTGSLRCFGEGVAITHTVTVRCMYGPVRCMCEHHTDP